MARFKVYLEYQSLARATLLKTSIIAEAEHPDEARKAAVRQFKSLAANGLVWVTKVKRARGE